MFTVSLSICILFCLMRFGQSAVFRIGGVFPFTGGSTRSSVQQMDAFLMAINDFNKIYALTKNLTIQYAVWDGGTTFSSTVVSTYTMLKQAFRASGSTGVRAVIGTDADKTSKAIGEVVQDFEVPMVSYGSPSTELSHGSHFPNSVRVYPSDTLQTAALVALIRAFGWSRVFVAQSMDTFGTDSAAQFEYYAKPHNINIVHKVLVERSNLAKHDSKAVAAEIEAIEAMKKYDARIVVLLLDDMESGVKFLKLAYDLGAISENTILLGTGRISNHNLWDTFPVDAQHTDSMLAKILGGYLGVDFADRDWMLAAPAGSSFVSTFLAQPPSVRTVGGVVQCSTARDSDGRLLYQYVNETGRTVCLGIDYSTLGVDSLDPLVGYAYDATNLALHGLLERIDGSMRVPEPDLLGVDMSALIIDHPGMPGVTGYVNVSVGNSAIGDYQHGDRIAGVRYSITNFVPGANRSQNKLQRIGTWQSEKGYIPCSNENFLQGALTGGCQATIQWGTPGNSLPRDRKDPVVAHMPPGVVGFLTALAYIQLAAAVFVTAVFGVFHKTRILKASQWQLMCVVLSSLYLGAGRILVASYHDSLSSASCMVEFWLGHLSFVGVIALLGMTLRVYIIVNAGLKKIKVRISDVFKFIALVTSVLVLYLIIVSATSPEEEHEYVTTAVDGQATIHRYCVAHYPWTDELLYALEALLIAILTYFCYQTRSVAGIINKTSASMKSISVISVAAVICYGIEEGAHLHPWEKELTTGVGFFVACMALFYWYFFPTCYYVLGGWELDKSLNLVRRHPEAETGKPGGLEGGVNGDAKVYVAAAEGNYEDENDDPLSGASKEQRQVIKKYMPKKIPQHIGECNTLIDFLRSHVTTLALKATKFSSDGVNSKSSQNSGYVSSQNELPSLALEAKGLTKSASTASITTLLDDSVKKY